MPWDENTIEKHNHHLNRPQRAKAAKIANHVLESTGDEGEALATAFKHVSGHAMSARAERHSRHGMRGAHRRG